MRPRPRERRDERRLGRQALEEVAGLARLEDRGDRRRRVAAAITGARRDQHPGQEGDVVEGAHPDLGVAPDQVLLLAVDVREAGRAARPASRWGRVVDQRDDAPVREPCVSRGRAGRRPRRRRACQ